VSITTNSRLGRHMDKRFESIICQNMIYTFYALIWS
jgi:hypothetical protein